MSSILFSGNSYAAPTPIRFAKGSECASWSGVAKDENPQLSVFLLKDQSISTKSDHPYKLKYPSKPNFGSGFFSTTSKGNYVFTFDVRKGVYFNFEICANN